MFITGECGNCNTLFRGNIRIVVLEINFYKIQEKIPVKNAIKKLDGGGICFIVCINQDDEVTGILTDGDF